jgi:type I restriction enzyme S subunit
LINEIVHEFNKVAWSKITSLTRIDLFNEIFGKFLANSFVDEKELGQYLTPIEMSRFMVRLSIQNLSNEEFNTLTDPNKCKNFGYILDPSCGAGSFLVEIVHQVLPIVIKKHGKEKANAWIENMGKYVLCGIDKSNRMSRLTIFNFCSLGIPCDNIYSINSLDSNKNKDILVKKLEGKVRIIITNPPFGAEFGGNLLTDFKLYNKWALKVPKKIDSELLFIEKYIDWLTSGGYCISVVPDSILTNRGLFYDLRNGIHPFIEIRSVISFPSETFSAAGTSTKTSVLCFVKDNKQSSQTYFGICKNVGFKVITKGSSKVKVATEDSDLDSILNEIQNCESNYKFGRRIDFDDSFHRWDANYHVSMSEIEIKKIQESTEEFITLSEVASLVNNRIDPRRVFKEFRYIEISDIQSSGIVVSKMISSLNAPSRARKQVKFNDVLASTVRPEQRKIGYVIDSSDDNAICTTGIAVLRPKAIEPSLLVELLKSEFVTRQLMRNNIGIAYPAIDENCFNDVLLPIKRSDLKKLNQQANEVGNLKLKLLSMENKYKELVWTLTNSWITDNNLI